MTPPTQKLASILLDEPVVEWIAVRRPGTSWLQIAYQLREATKGQVDVTPQTLINWAEAGAAAASERAS